MATSINAVITLAFESAGIVRVGQPPSGEHMNYGLRVLNEMLGLWQEQGIQHGLGDSVALSDSVYSGSLNSALRKNLAVELSKGPYDSNLSPVLLGEAMAERNNLMPHDGRMQYNRALSRSRSFNIETG